MRVGIFIFSLKDLKKKFNWIIFSFYRVKPLIFPTRGGLFEKINYKRFLKKNFQTLGAVNESRI
jgi:hypothetical protein